MLSTDSHSSCGRTEALRDYAFDEQLSRDERQSMEQHLAACGDCALELDQLRLTTAALHTLPDREIPQRIAFVSDRVFEPSLFRRFWSSSFASACVLAVALVVSAWHVSGHHAEPRTVVRTAAVSPDQIDAAVAKAVAQVRTQIAENDAQVIQAAVQAAERKRGEEYRNQMVALEENFDVLRKTMNRDYARLEGNEPGAGQ